MKCNTLAFFKTKDLAWISPLNDVRKSFYWHSLWYDVDHNLLILRHNLFQLRILSSLWTVYMNVFFVQKRLEFTSWKWCCFQNQPWEKNIMVIARKLSTPKPIPYRTHGVCVWMCVDVQLGTVKWTGWCHSSNESIGVCAACFAAINVTAFPRITPLSAPASKK